MAENQEDRSTEDLSEEASPFRLEESRRKGQVAQSREVTGILALFAAAATAYAISPRAGAQMIEFMREVFRTDLSARTDLGNLETTGRYFIKALKLVAAIGLPVAIAGFLMGVIGGVAQVGGIFSFDPIMPDFSKVNPIKGIQRMASKRQAIDGFRLIVKMCIVMAVAYSLVKSEVLVSPAQLSNEPAMMFQSYGRAAKGIFLSLVGILGVFAVIDFLVQRYEFNKGMRMNKQEAKQEHKEREGDPQIKARIRAVQREVARRRMMQAVKTADAIITNPTHIAIAVKYDKDSMLAPKVVAKGADFIAQKIKAIAAEAGVPLVENVPLARTLFKTVKVNQYVPRALYQAVAEVLAYVYRLRRREF